MKNKTFLAAALFFFLFSANFAFAAWQESEKEGVVIFVNLITIVIVGGVIYNIWINASGFGGSLGSAIKIMGAGIFLLSFDAIIAIIEGISGLGMSTLMGEGLAHDVAHRLLILAGFFIIGLGLSKLTKLVKSLK